MSDHLERSGLRHQLGFALRQASSAVWQDLVATLAPLGIRPQVYATLLVVEASPGLKQQDVADALAIQQSNLGALVDDLVRRALVAREVNADDRRSYSLRLTDAGRALLATARQAHAAHEARVVQAVGGDLPVLLDRLDRLRAIGTE